VRQQRLSQLWSTYLATYLIRLSETDVLYLVALVHRTRTWELIGFAELAFVSILQEMSYKSQTVTGLEALSPTNATKRSRIRVWWSTDTDARGERRSSPSHLVLLVET
jgi:hypothetical protein